MSKMKHEWVYNEKLGWMDTEIPDTRAKLIAEGVRKKPAPKSPKLTDQQVIEIRTLFTQWLPVKEIAEIYKVDPMIIHHLKAGRTYKHVKEES